MVKGINRAHSREILEAHTCVGNCVFISHKYEDLDAAREVASYIMDYGIDVYLDDCDCKLQKAVNMHNPKEIVSCIENGLDKSSHILVLVTENTRMSWWVPYETGYAKKGDKEIASLLLKEADEFPDYLQIEKTLSGLKDLTEFLNTLLMSTAEIMTESAALEYEHYCVERRHRSSLLEYIRR